MAEPEAALVRKFARGLGDVLAGRHAAWAETSRLARELADATGKPVRFNVEGRSGCAITIPPTVPREESLGAEDREVATLRSETAEELAALRLEEILRLRREREEIRIDRSLHEALKPIPPLCEPGTAGCPKDAEQRPPIGVTPDYIWREQRCRDLLAAISRYDLNSDTKGLRIAWCGELAEHLQWLSELRQ